MKKVKLNDGHEMPIIGFGVYQIPQDATKQAVAEALKVGYRMVDTAQAYGNEVAVGQAVAESGLKREEIFVTSKIFINNMGYEKSKAAINQSLKNLGFTYLDLMLIHQPYGDVFGTWKAMAEAQKEGKIKSIGVSNFSPYRLHDLEVFSGVKPALNQIEINPFYQRLDEIDYYKTDNIQLESWASFAEGQNGIFTNPIIKSIGDKYNKSNAQVILRWLIQKNIIVIPKSVTPARVKQNFEVFDFELSTDDMEKMKTLDTKTGLWNHETPAAVDQIFSFINQ